MFARLIDCELCFFPLEKSSLIQGGHHHTNAEEWLQTWHYRGAQGFKQGGWAFICATPAMTQDLGFH